MENPVNIGAVAFRAPDPKPEEVALNRLKILTPILIAIEEKADAAKIIYLKSEAMKQYGISRRTLCRWLDSYGEAGFEGLKPMPRSNGNGKVIPEELIQEAILLRREVPSRSVLLIGYSVTVLYDPRDIESIFVEHKSTGMLLRAKELKIGEHTGARPKLPDFLTPAKPETSRLLDGKEKIYQQRKGNTRRAISYKAINEQLESGCSQTQTFATHPCDPGGEDNV